MSDGHDAYLAVLRRLGVLRRRLQLDPTVEDVAEARALLKRTGHMKTRAATDPIIRAAEKMIAARAA